MSASAIAGKQVERWFLLPDAATFARHLDRPLRWTKLRHAILTNDLFDGSLSNEAIAAVFGVMAAAPRHTFQVLTKRPERMREWFEWAAGRGEDLQAEIGQVPPPGVGAPASYCVMVVGEKATAGVLTEAQFEVGVRADWPLPNVWLGVSVEDQATADARIPLLLQTPAAKRFVSYEPALGPVDFAPWMPIPTP